MYMCICIGIQLYTWHIFLGKHKLVYFLVSFKTFLVLFISPSPIPLYCSPLFPVKFSPLFLPFPHSWQLCYTILLSRVPSLRLWSLTGNEWLLGKGESIFSRISPLQVIWTHMISSKHICVWIYYMYSICISIYTSYKDVCVCVCVYTYIGTSIHPTYIYMHIIYTYHTYRHAHTTHTSSVFVQMCHMSNTVS